MATNSTTTTEAMAAPSLVKCDAAAIRSDAPPTNSLTYAQRGVLCFASGGIALSAAFAAMHPLDSLKTQRQVAAAPSSSSYTAGRAASEAPRRSLVRGLFRGFAASVAGAAPQGGLRLATYELVRAAVQQHHEDPLPPAAVAAAAAVAGDSVSSIVKVPREVVTARLQSGHYSGAAAAVRSILRADGVRGLFRGFWSTTARDWPFMVILFATYETFKRHHHRVSLYPSHPQPISASGATISERASISDDDDDLDDVTIPTLKSTLFGGVSGALAGFLTTPFDVIKTRIVTQQVAMPSAAPAASVSSPTCTKTTSMLAVARQIWSETHHPAASHSAGMPARAARFFVGGGARSLWWFCVCSIFFPVYETAKETLRPAVVATIPTGAQASSSLGPTGDNSGSLTGTFTGTGHSIATSLR